MGIEMLKMNLLILRYESYPVFSSYWWRELVMEQGTIDQKTKLLTWIIFVAGTCEWRGSTGE